MWVYLYFANLFGRELILRDSAITEANQIKLRRTTGNTFIIERYNVGTGLYEQLYYNVSTGEFDSTISPTPLYYLKTEHVDVTAGLADAAKPIKLDATGYLDSSFLERIGVDHQEGRLCLATGAPKAVNQAASTTLYFTPSEGNKISLLVGGVKMTKTFAESTIDVSALTVDKNYDIFAYWDSGTSSVKIEALVWTDDSTRATALVFSNGVYYKSGDTTRRYLGTIRTFNDGGTVKCQDTEAKRFVDNVDNKMVKSVVSSNSNASWTYAVHAVREFNNGTGQSRGEFVNGLERSMLINLFCGIELTATKAQIAHVGIGYDSVAAFDTITSVIGGTSASALSAMASLSLNKASAAGYHYFTGLEDAVAVDGDSIKIGNASNSVISSQIMS